MKTKMKLFKKTGKSFTLLVSLLLLLSVTVGGTIAYLSAKTEPLDNEFTPSEVTTEVNEDFENNKKENVTIKNTGDTEAWIRAAIIVTWQDNSGNVYGKKPMTKSECRHENPNCTCDYTITFGDSWTKGADGFYYYTSPVDAENSTSALIETCSSKNTAPEDYYLNVEIIGSGIQSVPDSVVESVWSNDKVDVKVNTVDGVRSLSVTAKDSGGTQ